MDLQISFFLLFVLFKAGQSLECYECMGLTGSCADQKVKTCSGGLSRCMSSTVVTQTDVLTMKVKVKACSTDCENWSMNFGMVKMTSACCATNQCNVQDAPDPSTNNPNGKKCYSCDEKSCTNILSCSGNEDRCITATRTFGGQSTSVKGCTSKSVCDATSSVTDVKGISCCSGNLCNGAKSITQSFLFLFCSLLSFLILH